MSEVPEHYLSQPKIMSCGHAVCASCLNLGVEIFCATCGQAITTGPCHSDIEADINMKIEDNLKTYFDDICIKLSNVEDELKG
jgi:hypothetical protein